MVTQTTVPEEVVCRGVDDMGAIMGLDLVVQVAATQEGALTWPGEMAGGGALFSFLPSFPEP